MKTIIFILILSSFSGIIYYLTKKFDSKFIPATSILILSVFLSMIIPLSESNVELLHKIIINLTPATIYLFSLDFNLNSLFKNQIGCSCKMGAKKYWFIVLLSGVISIISQISTTYINIYNPFITSLLIALSLGILSSFTKLKELNGTQEVATTMLYLLSAVSGFFIRYLA
jgi:hypothetical protein